MFHTAIKYYKLLNPRLLFLTFISGFTISSTIIVNSYIAILFSEIASSLSSGYFREELIMRIITFLLFSFLANIIGEYFYTYYKGKMIVDLRDRVFSSIINMNYGLIREKGSS